MNIFTNFMKSAANTYIKNKPAIMTGIALVSLATTVVIAMKEAPKIKEVVDEKQENIERIKSDDQSGFSEADKQEAIRNEVTDGAKKLALPMLKIGVAFGITVFAIMGINKAHTAREVAASALLESYKNQIIGYEQKLPDLIGKKKAEEVKHDVIVEAADKMCEAHGTNKEKYKEINYNDRVPMRDDFGNRWIASKQELDKAINYLESEKMGGGKPGRRNVVNYADFLEEYFSDVELIAKARNWFFDPEYWTSVNTTVYQDKFLNTVGYQVSFRSGAPVDERKLDGKYD